HALTIVVRTATSSSTTSPVSLPTFFFFTTTATPQIYTLSLHDALPICHLGDEAPGDVRVQGPDRGEVHVAHPADAPAGLTGEEEDRKSTRLNSSHLVISYAVFCLKKKKKRQRVHVPLDSGQIGRQKARL